MNESYNLLSKKEVCALLRISKNTLERIVQDGDLPVYKVRGSCKFKQQDVDAYLEGCLEIHVRQPLPKPVKRPSGRASGWDAAPAYYPGMKVV